MLKLIKIFMFQIKFIVFLFKFDTKYDWLLYEKHHYTILEFSCLKTYLFEKYVKKTQNYVVNSIVLKFFCFMFAFILAKQ